MTGPVTMPAVRMDNRPTQVTHFPQVLTTEQALGVRRVAENRSTNGNRLGSAGYGLYNEAATSNSGSDMGPPFVDWEPQLRMRQDIGFTTLAMGGRYKTHQATQRKGGQFRDAFAYGDSSEVGIQALMRHEGFFEAARAMHRGEKPLIHPQIMFANFFLPGEIQGIHTDVPEFRGSNRQNTPEWMLVAMHHSGLFARHYMTICTAVAWFSNHKGGELCYYPDPSKPGVPLPTPFNSALVVDTDSVYHGVDPNGGLQTPAPVVPLGCRLVHKGAGRWCVNRGDGTTIERYADLSWDDIRLSVQWKAYCFKDEDERQLWLNHTDDIRPVDAFNTLVDAVKRAGVLALDSDADVRGTIKAITQHFIRVPDELQRVHDPPAAQGVAAAKL